MNANQQDQSSLRDRKKAETRANIARAAVQLLVDEGPENTTIARIAEAAGISQRTFHNYFPHREAALFHYMENLLDVLCQSVLSSADGQPLMDVTKNVAVGLYFHGSSSGDATTASPAPSTPSQMNAIHALKMVVEHLTLQRMGGICTTNPRENPVGFLSPLVDALSEYAHRNGEKLARFQALMMVSNALWVCATVYETHLLPEYSQGKTERQLLDEAFSFTTAGASPESEG